MMGEVRLTAEGNPVSGGACETLTKVLVALGEASDPGSNWGVNGTLRFVLPGLDDNDKSASAAAGVERVVLAALGDLPDAEITVPVEGGEDEDVIVTSKKHPESRLAVDLKDLRIWDDLMR